MPPDLFQVLERVGARQASADHLVYDLREAWWPFSPENRTLEGRQTQLLEAVREYPAPLYWCLEEEPSAFDPRQWQLVAPGTWVPPAEIPTRELRSRWLSTGNWQIYAAPEPVRREEIPDSFRTSPAEITRFLQRSGVLILLDSFHDDRDWRISLHPRVRWA